MDEQLLNILACPECKSDIRVKDEKIVCLGCNRKYPIKEGTPVLLVEEAEQD